MDWKKIQFNLEGLHEDIKNETLMSLLSQAPGKIPWKIKKLVKKILTETSDPDIRECALKALEHIKKAPTLPQFSGGSEESQLLFQAMEGDPAAPKKLVELYQSGAPGLEKNLILAYVWESIARGAPGEEIDFCYLPEMTEQEIKIARAKALTMAESIKKTSKAD
ncbi:hypothetical protein ACFL35_05635 [Candidatus Riflebacteria bacterium]